MLSIDDITSNIRTIATFVGKPGWPGDLAEWLLPALVEDLRAAVVEALKKPPQ